MTHYRAQPGGKETSSPNPSPSPSSPSIASKKLASGAIAGIVTGILFLFFALIGAFFCIRRRRAQASTQTAAQPFNVPDDNEREVKESDFYSPPIPPRSQPPGSVAPVLGHQQLATRPDATRYATPNAASSRHFGSSDIPHATMPPVERGLVVPYFDSSAETARRQQTLAFEKARDPHWPPVPNHTTNPITPPFDPSIDAVRRDQTLAFEKVARGVASSTGAAGSPSRSSTKRLPAIPGAAPSPPLAGDDREAIQRQIRMLQEQVEVLARNQIPRSGASDAGTVPPAYGQH
jgi:hypothetical protein